MFYATPFDSLEYRLDGLLLSSCGCGGSARHFIPRSQVSHISHGRRHHLGLVLTSVAILIIGLVLFGFQGITEVTVPLLLVGVFLLVPALIMMIPTSLVIAATNGTFVSRACCQLDRLDELSEWLITGIARDSATVYMAPMTVLAQPGAQNWNAAAAVPLTAQA